MVTESHPYQNSLFDLFEAFHRSCPPLGSDIGTQTGVVLCSRSLPRGSSQTRKESASARRSVWATRAPTSAAVTPTSPSAARSSALHATSSGFKRMGASPAQPGRLPPACIRSKQMGSQRISTGHLSGSPGEIERVQRELTRFVWSSIHIWVSPRKCARNWSYSCGGYVAATVSRRMRSKSPDPTHS